MKQKKSNNVRAAVLSPLVIVGLSLVLSSVLIIGTGVNPLQAYYYMLSGAFGTPANIINTINKAVPICFAGFAVAIGRKAGIFNIGVEGQLIMGAFGSALAGIYLKGLPAIVHIPLALLAGMIFGAVYALLPGILYIKRNVNLLVAFILMNNVAGLLITYFVVGPFAGDNKMISATDSVAATARLPYLIARPSRLTIGFLIMAVTALLIWIYMNKTVSGYEMQSCGQNREAARYAGIPVNAYILAGILLSGALGGMAGGVEVLGNYHRLYDGFSPGYGFDGIPIALLSGGHPLGIILGAVLFGALRVGAIYMQTQLGVSSEIVSIIQGLLVTLIACESIIRFWLAGGKRRKEAV